MKKKYYLYLMILLIISFYFGYILSFFSQKKIKYNTILYYEPNIQYSLLINDERFPLKISENDVLNIQIYNCSVESQKINFPKHTIIHYRQNEKKMTKVKDSRFLFRYDSPQKLKTFYRTYNLQRFQRKIELDTIVSVMKWVRSQFEPQQPDVYPPQNGLELLDEIRTKNGKGFCAQYCYLTVQILQSLGFFSRYVTINDHEVCEVWINEYNKWIVIDPMNEAFFVNRNDKKCYLNALEINENRNIVEIITPRIIENKKELINRFQILEYWLRNDLFTNPINLFDIHLYKVIPISVYLNNSYKNNTLLISYYPHELYEKPFLYGNDE